MKKQFDYSKISKMTWDKEILNYIGLICELKGKQQLYLDQKPDRLDKLVEIAKVQSVEASNAIEGIVTTNQRLNSLMLDKTTPKNRSEMEIKGYRHVLNIIHENYDYIPLTPNYILQLHKELYQFSDMSYGGRFKDVSNEIVENYPDGKKRVLFKPLEPYETEEAIVKICDEYDIAVKQLNIEPLVLIPIFIHDFLCIHPFNDGNGRMSRLLTTMLMYKNNYMISKYISLEKKIEITKDDYYTALQESSKGWREGKNDNTYFIKYMLGVVLAAYRDFDERVNMIGEKLSARDMVDRAVKSKIGKFTKKNIEELCPEIGRCSVENALKAMCDEGLLKKEGKGKSTFYHTNL